MPVYCKDWGKKPNKKTQGKLKKKQIEIDLLVYKPQWFLEHWLMMSECLGLPKVVNWNVTLVCLSAWAIYGEFPLCDKGRESRRCRSWKFQTAFHYLVSSPSLNLLGMLHFNSVTKNTGQDGCWVCWCFSLNKAQISVCIVLGLLVLNGLQRSRLEEERHGNWARAVVKQPI